MTIFSKNWGGMAPLSPSPATPMVGRMISEKWCCIQGFEACCQFLKFEPFQFVLDGWDLNNLNSGNHF